MKFNHTLAAFTIGFALFLSSCKEKTAKNNLPPPQKIQVTPVIIKNVPIYKEFVGQVYGLLDIPIRARVEGFLEGIYFREGLSVKKGQVLHTIDSQPFLADVASAESKVAEAQTYLVNATNELERYKPLAEINAVSKSDLDATQASRDAAESSLNAAKANLKLANINLGYCTIKSPIDGLIGKTEARVGEFVGREPNPVILNIVSQISSARVQFFITEAEYLILSKTIQARMDDNQSKDRPKDNLELILADGSMYEEKGTVDFIDRNVDTSTGTILVQATFPNPNQLLRPGMFSKVRVKLETMNDAVLVPQRSIMELQGQRSVYVIDHDNKVSARQIVATEKIDDLWLVEEGLKAGEKVVVSGLQKVASGVTINPEIVDYKSQTNQ